MPARGSLASSQHHQNVTVALALNVVHNGCAGLASRTGIATEDDDSRASRSVMEGGVEAGLRLTRGHCMKLGPWSWPPAPLVCPGVSRRSPRCFDLFSKILQRFENANHRHGFALDARPGRAKTFSNPALDLVVLMTYDSIIKPPVTEFGAVACFSASADSRARIHALPECTHRQAHGF